MTKNEKHIAYLFTAELQFRLASAVHLATTLNAQPLDLPTEWTHGKHSVKNDEIGLRPDQADYAAYFLHRSSAFLIGCGYEGRDSGNSERSKKTRLTPTCGLHIRSRAWSETHSRTLPCQRHGA